MASTGIAATELGASNIMDLVGELKTTSLLTESFSKMHSISLSTIKFEIELDHGLMWIMDPH